MKKSFLLTLAILIGLAAHPTSIDACSRAYPFRLGELFSADFIIRATAVRYIVAPDPKKPATPVPESTIEFKTEERIWGVHVPETIALHGYLTDEDDFNEVPLPYRFVRPGGRGGICFANNYKKGAQFLLFVKRSTFVTTNTGYSIDISALGPTNEQLRGPRDLWVMWVKAYLTPCARQSSEDVDYAALTKTELQALMGKQQSDLAKYRLAKCYLVKFGASGMDAARYLEVIDFYETIPQQK